MEGNFSNEWRGWGGSLGMIQAHYIYCALYFSYITSAPPQVTRQDPRDWIALEDFVEQTAGPNM